METKQTKVQLQSINVLYEGQNNHILSYTDRTQPPSIIHVTAISMFTKANTYHTGGPCFLYVLMNGSSSVVSAAIRYYTIQLDK